MAHLLIVEDDELLRDALNSQLLQAGHHITTASDAEEAMEKLQVTKSDDGFDAVVLDLGLPRMDGLTLLHTLRQRLPALPVLILTARDGVDDRVAGLNAGADDYLTKPFNQTELQARLQAMLRRASLPAFGRQATPPTSDVDSQRPLLRLDPHLPRAWLEEAAIELTPREWVLLGLLVQSIGRVISREEVLSAWQAEGTEAGGVASNALEVYVHRLRRKLEHPDLTIRNIRGLGYMLEVASV